MTDVFFIPAPNHQPSLSPEDIARVREIVERETGEGVVIEAHSGFLCEPGGELWDKVTAHSTTRRSSEIWFAESMVRHAFVADVGADVACLHVGRRLAERARLVVERGSTGI